MPRSINGIGTMYCGYGAAVYWNKPGLLTTETAEHDAVECATVFMLPIVPFRPVHVFDHTGNVCREVPLRWSSALIARAYLRPWLFLLVTIGGLCAIGVAGVLYLLLVEKVPVRNPPVFYWMIGLSTLLPISIGLLRWLGITDRHNRDIRLILGRHSLGTSDPAMWREDIFSKSKPPAEIFGTDNVAAAGNAALKEGDFPRAMLAARMLIAQGKTLEGDEMTDRILRDPHVLEFLEKARREPWRRDEFLPENLKLQKAEAASKEAERIKAAFNPKAAAPAAGAATYKCALTGRNTPIQCGAIFYDGRFYSDEVLDAAGGEGYAEFVRANPEISCKAPAPFFIRFVLIGFIIMMGAAGIQEMSKTPPKKDWLEALMGFLFFAGIVGWFLYFASRRRVILGDGRLFVGVNRGQATLVDAIKKISRRRYLLVFSSISVKSLGGEILWPASAEKNAEIEKAIGIAIKINQHELALPAANASANTHS